MRGLGEIVEVEGGHIVRSTGRKDRHSKVCTAKGPRDRRVRLSAHTAIQFYDVQDRLGYDRPSKAVDWLIDKAKPAIDQLKHLPPWNPTTTTNTNTNTRTSSPLNNYSSNSNPHHPNNTSAASTAEMVVGNGGGVLQNQQLGENCGFLPQGLESSDIADTIRSFFPTTTTSSSPMIQFQNYPPHLLSRTTSRNNNNNNNNQDLRLSLQSFQDPILLHRHQAQNNHHNHHHQNEHMLFSTATTTAPVGFDGMVAWNNACATDTGHGGHGGGVGGGFIFNSPSPSPTPSLLPAAVFGQSQYFSQRGPLQSSYNPSIRAWVDDPSVSTVAADHHHHQQLHHHYLLPAMMHQFSGSGTGFASTGGGGGFSGFRVPARIQGEEEEHDGVSDKPSSASSDSRH